MDQWRVNVRAEDALARGRLQEDAMEFFVRVLKAICKALGLRVAIGSKTVGKELGRQDKAARLVRVVEKWRAVWAGNEVREQEELLVPVAVDERSAPQDWVFLLVRSKVQGQKLGTAEQLRVEVFDVMQRESIAQGIARSVDVLVRGVTACVDGREPDVECLSAPACRVSAQRMLSAFGFLIGRVAVRGAVPALPRRSCPM